MAPPGTYGGLLGGAGDWHAGSTTSTSASSITPEHYYQMWAQQQQRTSVFFDCDTNNNLLSLGKPFVAVAPKPLSFYDKLRKEIDEWIKV